MVSGIGDLTDWAWDELENSLLPTHQEGMEKVATYAYQFFKFIALLPVAMAGSTLTYLAKRIGLIEQPKLSPLAQFAKYPVWEGSLGKIAPVEIGFTSHLDDSTGAEKVPDLWHYPDRAINRLKEIGATKFSFSISREKIQPQANGEVDQIALQQYAKLCARLIQEGIEPLVTLGSSYTPHYFTWERSDQVGGFVQYANTIANALYDAGVRKLITINEPTVVAFQGWVMGQLHPHQVGDFKGAAHVIENMMSAHVQIYKSLKAQHPDLTIGLSHDPIQFQNFHTLNPLLMPAEKIWCHYLTEIHHTSLFNFLKTGKFEMKVPFCVDHSFEFAEKPPLDFIGVQYYSDPLLSLSLTGEKSLEFSPHPQGLATILDQLSSLEIPIELTEIGMDTGINCDTSDEERIQYYDRVFQVVERALEQGVNVRSLHFWTLIDHPTWSTRFGFYSFDSKTGQMAPRPTVTWLKEQISNRKADLCLPAI